MKRLAFLFFLPLAGCGTNPPPVVEAKALPTAAAEGTEAKPPPRPAASDEAGAKLLAEVLAAHGGADKLAALRACSFTRKGTADVPNGKAASEWAVALDYPARYRLRMELNFGATKLLNVYALTPAGGWTREGIDPAKKALSADFARTTAAQMHEDSVSLLFGLADPKAVAVRVPAEDAGKGELALHVWTPGVEFVRVWVTPATKRMARFSYLGREGTAATTKEVVVADSKTFGALTLPSRMSVRAPGRQIAEWSDLTLNPAKPDAAVFDGE